MSHLPTAPGAPPLQRQLERGPEGEGSLTIEVWDSASTGVPLPPECGALEEHLAHGMPATRASDGIYSAYLRPDPGLSMLSLPHATAVYWLPDAARTPYEARAHPYRAILNWWLVDRGLQFVHGACVGTDAGGVLIGAKSGSGKSTTALACLLEGMRYAGDDYCLAEPRPGAPYIHSLYSTGKLHGHNIERLPALRQFLSNPHRLEYEKGVFLLNDYFPEQVVLGLPLRAVLVPKVSGRRETAVVPASAGAALTALAPSTLLQLASARAESFAAMTALVRAVPCFTLELGSDMAGVTAAIRALIARLTDSGAK